MDFNNITITGRATKDCVFRPKDERGFAIASFVIAQNQKTKEGDHTNYIPVDLYNAKAESLHKYITKGKEVLVSGSIRINNLKNEDQYKTFVAIRADKVVLLGKKEEEK